MRRAIITLEEIDAFLTTGFVHLPGLIPTDLCQAAERAFWRAAEIDLDRAESWPEGWYMNDISYELAEVQDCAADELARVIDELAGAHHWEWGPFGRSRPPVSAIAGFPFRQEREWRSPLELREENRPGFGDYRPHIDQYSPVAIPVPRLRRAWWRVLRRLRLTQRTHPGRQGTFVINVLLYLHEVPGRHGATLFWPGSHKEIQKLSAETRIKPPDLLVQRLFEPGDRFIEATGDVGDALLYTRNLVHAASMNISNRPRLALQIPVHLNKSGLERCLTGSRPRTAVERIYDEHMDQPDPLGYFVW